MSNVATAVRTASEEVLRADADFIAAHSPSSVRLYPLTSPMPPRFPYGLILIDVVGDDTECAAGSEVTVTLELFAREATHVESAARVEAMAGAAREALTDQLTLDGHVIDEWQFNADREVSDPDPLTAHRSMSITYWTTATA